jgi:hypothetical protein
MVSLSLSNHSIRKKSSVPAATSTPVDNARLAADWAAAPRAALVALPPLSLLLLPGLLLLLLLPGLLLGDSNLRPCSNTQVATSSSKYI